MKKYSLFYGVSLVLLSGCGPGTPSHPFEAWDTNNDPTRAGNGYEARLAALPQEGSVEERRIPWSDSYWPNNLAGIAQRWYQSSGEDNFHYGLYTADHLKNMGEWRLKQLSPAEKYDAFMGRLDFPTVTLERERTNVRDPRWNGLCHGWAMAALLYVEPVPVKLTGKLGVEIPFGSSDVKALLSYYAGQVKMNSSSRLIGARCNALRVGNQPECRDVNAGTFHIIATNEIGLKKRGFVADFVRGGEVWNFPIYAYKSKKKAERAYSGSNQAAVSEVEFETEVSFARDGNARYEVYKKPVTKSLSYRYTVELDANGRIVGGEWKQWDRPDFIWTTREITFDGYWSGLSEIYRAAR